ncbi:MAG: hypothetical protein EXR71_13565 [Myxococcales bacterium]|nr:hypothetical protein [Myxococcales bacterium]
MHVASARPENLYRSAQHALSSLVVILLLEMALSEKSAVVLATAFAALAWTLELTRRRFPAWNQVLMRTFGVVAHKHEATAVNSATWMCTGLALIAPFFALPTLALAVASVGFGDPAAGFVGRRFGRIKLVHGRSLEGTVAYGVVAFLSGWAILSIWHPSLGGRGIIAAAVAAVTGAIVELFSSRIDDNFAVPILTAAAVGVVLQGGGAWMVG